MKLVHVVWPKYSFNNVALHCIAREFDGTSSVKDKWEASVGELTC